jgi:trigger factor
MMKARVESVSGIEKRIVVEIPAADVAAKVEEVYAEVRNTVPLRGFRRGKAPMSMVKRLFRDNVEGDVSERLVKDSLAEAVKQHDLKVLAFAKMEGGKFVEGADFTFEATVEVVPEVEAKDYKGIPVALEKAEVTDGDVESALERIREAASRFEAADGRGAREGDLVEVSFLARAGGEELERRDPAALLLQGGIPYGKDFDGKLEGMKAGEARSFDVAYGEDFPNGKFAGKTVSFEIAMKGVKEKVLPALDDGLAKTVGGGDTLGELREKLRERILADAKERSRLKAEEDLKTGLVERNAFEVPKTLVERQTRSMVEETAGRLASQGVDLRKMNLDFDKMRERYEEGAEKAVRVSLLLEAIGRKEGIDVSFSDIDAEMHRLAEAMNVPYEKVRDHYSEEERLDDLRGRLVDRKVVDFLLENATEKTGGAA